MSRASEVSFAVPPASPSGKSAGSPEFLGAMMASMAESSPKSVSKPLLPFDAGVVTAAVTAHQMKPGCRSNLRRLTLLRHHAAVVQAGITEVLRRSRAVKDDT